MLSEHITRVEDALFASPLARLVKLLSFNLKGKTAEVQKSILTLTRIKSLEELNEGASAGARFLLKKYEHVNVTYEALFARAKKAATDDSIVIFMYEEDTLSLTKDLANELLYTYPEKVIILGREKSGELRISLRSAKYELPQALQQAFHGLQGRGGGHEHACGASVKKEDFSQFVENLRRELEKQSNFVS